MIECLLVIDFPDERLGHRHQFNHMHAWGSQDEMEVLRRRLVEQIGGNHMVVDGYVCPFCGIANTGGRRASPQATTGARREVFQRQQREHA